MTTITRKHCAKCGRSKPLTEFHKAKGYRLGVTSYCKPCALEYTRKRYAENKAENIARVREWKKNNPDKVTAQRIKHRYGLAFEDYEKMLEAQNHACAICTKPFVKAPDVDHCHTTERVRGLLCRRCNTWLGLFREDVSALRRAIEYLTIGLPSPSRAPRRAAARRG